MISTMRFLKFYTNDVQQTCFEVPSCWEMEGLWENLWAHSLADMYLMHLYHFKNHLQVCFSTQLMSYLCLLLW